MLSLLQFSLHLVVHADSKENTHQDKGLCTFNERHGECEEAKSTGSGDDVDVHQARTVVHTLLENVHQ